MSFFFQIVPAGVGEEIAQIRSAFAQNPASIAQLAVAFVLSGASGHGVCELIVSGTVKPV